MRYLDKDMSAMISRRQYLKSVLAAGALSPGLISLSGCESLIQVLGQSCPKDPAESAGIDWTPDILHPVFWGFQDLDVANGAPGPLRIFYPTYEGVTNGAPILKLCLPRYPVVLFLHGQQPQSCSDVNYYRRWNAFGMVLARSGYVVVAPKHTAVFPQSEESSGPEIAYVLRVVDWVRNGWEHRQWVDARAESTAVAGHSYGALLAARVRIARPTISAYVGFSGPWGELSNGAGPVLNANHAPSFFMWGKPNDVDADLDHTGLWSAVPFGRTKVIFQGEHFDYLGPWPGCNVQRGSCTLIELVAAELAALFIARHVPVNLSHAPIPPSLDPPAVTLTQHQQFFAGAHLNGIGLIKTRLGCSADLVWNDPVNTGSRHLGP